MQAVDIDGHFHDVSSDEISWRVHVYAIVIENDRVLLSPQHGPGRYDLPGGKVDIGESLEDGLLREVREETGVDVRITRQLATRDNLFKVTFREPQEVWHSVMIYYLCEKTGGDISDEGFDHHEREYASLAEWVELSRLDQIQIAASYDWREFVRQALHD